jgi:hypothetical protein
MKSIKVRLAMAGLLGTMALGSVGASVVQAGTSTCRVRNATQDTAGRSFNAIAKDARDGDLLLIRGTCEADGDALRIEADIVIRGVGVHRAILTGLDRHRVLLVRPRAVVALWHVVIEHGHPGGHGDLSDAGGGILNRGTLTVVDSIIRRNAAERLGGGIFNYAPPCRGLCKDASLTLMDTLVTGNRARWGAGIHNNGSYEGGDARLTMQHSVVRGNGGSGIYNWGSAVLEDSVVARDRGVGIDNYGWIVLRRSAVRGNLAGGIANEDDDEISYGTIVLADSIVASNVTDSRGGGILNDGGTVRLRRSTVTGNSAATRGGGIWSGLFNSPYGLPAMRGRLILEDRSSVTANTSGDAGGGIYNKGGVVRINGSTVIGNATGGLGGGIFNRAGHDEDWDETVPGTITLDPAASVTGNTPDDCYGTTAC